ncbi:MAG: lysylphosphatidylglycerol synthase transmembrane domain-containing protein [Bacteroidota bacterium]
MNLKKILLYTAPLLFAGALLWYTYRNADFAQMGTDIGRANFVLIFLSFVPQTISHLLRAQRWRMLLAPLGYKPGLLNTFKAVMAGYFGNMILPRMGEVTRCGLLLKSDKIPVDASVGTVITERALDLIMLGIITTLALLLEFDKLSKFLLGMLSQKQSADAAGNAVSSGQPLLLYGAIAGLLVLVVVFFVFRARLMAHPITKKITDFALGMLKGALSITKMKGTGWFILHSFLIWGGYFLTNYLTMLAFGPTSGMGLKAGLLILVIGSYGMVAPVQGGLGAYHYMVTAGLMQIYAITQADSQSAAFLLHTVSTVYVILVGGVCFVLGLAKVADKDVAATVDPLPA